MAGPVQQLQPRNLSWTGRSVRFCGCRARRNDAEWSFHSKELQRSHASAKPCNPACSAATKRVNVKISRKLIRNMPLNFQKSGQLRFLGLLHSCFLARHLYTCRYAPRRGGANQRRSEVRAAGSRGKEQARLADHRSRRNHTRRTDRHAERRNGTNPAADEAGCAKP